jgi:hypothetical protein
LHCDDPSQVLVNEVSVGSPIESLGGEDEGLGEGLPLGKGMAAPPVAACCVRVVVAGVGRR